MSFIKRALYGLIIGIAAVTPGLSGGVLAAALGLYEPGVRAVTGIFKKPRESINFLLPLGIGVGAGILLFSNAMRWLMDRAPHEVLFLFFGLVTGSLPSVVREANHKGFRYRYLLALFIALGAVLCADWLGGVAGTGTGAGWGFGRLLLYGIILAVGTIVPGISSSFVLMYFGAYEGLLKAISEIDLAVLIPVAVGFALGAIPLIKLVEVLFRRYPGASYYAVLGFLLGSMAVVFPGLRSGWPLAGDLLLFAVGIVLSVLLISLNGREGAKDAAPG